MMPGDTLKERNLALVAAVVNRDADIIVAQLRQGANIHHEDDFPLRCAAYLGYSDIAELLLKNGANVHAGGEEPLLMAVKARDNVLIELLLNNKADLQAVLDNNRGKLDKGSVEFITHIQTRDAKAAAERRARELREKARRVPRPKLA
jgi:ankyrin repeat protein